MQGDRSRRHGHTAQPARWPGPATCVRHYFGLESDAADAFNAAFKIPNFLQNLFGEGALSASFIPVYASLLSRKDQREADRVAGAVASALALTVSVIVLVGVLVTPVFIDAIAPGFSGESVRTSRFKLPGFISRRRLVRNVRAVPRRIEQTPSRPAFIHGPCHVECRNDRRSGIGGKFPLPRLAIILAWGSVAGAALQFVVQLPVVFRIAPQICGSESMPVPTRS